MNTKSRLLGMAFAAADTLVELDADGRVSLALGAGPSPQGPLVESWTGTRLTDLVGKAGQKQLADALRPIRPNVRTAPTDALMAFGSAPVRKARPPFFQPPATAPGSSCPPPQLRRFRMCSFG